MALHVLIVLSLLFFIAFVSEANAQGNKSSKDDLPVWQGYSGISIGMSAADVRKKMGNPKMESDTSFFYVISDTETVDIMLDSEKTVSTISAMFTDDHKNPPKFEEVFGKDVKAEPKPDGAIFKRINFPEAGFWLSYSRLAGAKAMVIVVISGRK